MPQPELSSRDKARKNDLDRPGNLVRSPDMPSDAGLRALMGEIRARQQASLDEAMNITPESLGFKLMRTIPRAQWGTTFPDLDPVAYRRGQKDQVFAQQYPFNIWHPGLKKLTPGHMIRAVFDAQANQPGPRAANQTQ